MRLMDMARNGPAFLPSGNLGADPALATEVQRRLALAGLLDPPADGTFGAVSRWALSEFQRRLGVQSEDGLTREAARHLLDDGMTAPAPAGSGGDLASRILAAMHKRGAWICRHPDCLNIVYVEGMDPDGTPNRNAPNAFNDTRLLLSFDDAGRAHVVMAWEATTEPGRKFTIAPQDPNGAARIAFGQQKSWVVGTHKKGKPSEHESLVQDADITVHRDLNRDFARDGDRLFQGIFGVNQHWGSTCRSTTSARPAPAAWSAAPRRGIASSWRW